MFEVVRTLQTPMLKKEAAIEMMNDLPSKSDFVCSGE